ncbi:MAG: hypothetical protein U9Q90_00985 [Campylobacterota bacterium]|nr:hypothetical protein [Campylobacterota bacterium]
MKKLRSREEKINRKLGTKLDKKEENKLKEELDIISLQINKGEKILNKLDT